MSAFKLVLCLAGLAIYLVFKQFVVNASTGGSQPFGPAIAPSKHTGAHPASVAPETCPAPTQALPAGEERRGKPQTVPHTEVLKSDREWAMHRK